MNIAENYPSIVDPCVQCGRSTAFGSGNGLFVNRIGADEGWMCAECAGYECDECGEVIGLDEEIRVEYEDENGYHYGNYHEDCYDREKHGVCDSFCDNCGDGINNYEVYETLPWDVASARAGESAILCQSCDAGLHAGKTWQELSGGPLQELSDN